MRTPADRAARTAALLCVVALAGCGSSSASSSQTSVPAAATAASQAGTVSSSSTGHHRSPARRRAPRTNSPTSSTTTGAPRPVATSSTPAARVRSAPKPTPTGTPAAPAGLTQSVGYGTYELCQGSCSGSVPASLRRPLKLSSSAGGSCPASDPPGPVRPEGAMQLTVGQFVGSSWLGARVSWGATARYKGPILIRGRELGGPGAVGFGEGHTPYDELQLLDSGQNAPPASGGARAWLSFTRVRARGCYAYQVDGTSFSSVIVFRAAG